MLPWGTGWLACLIVPLAHEARPARPSGTNKGSNCCR